MTDFYYIFLTFFRRYEESAQRFFHISHTMVERPQPETPEDSEQQRLAENAERFRKGLSVNKIGGSNMSRLGEVGKLVEHLQQNGESPVLVVSAFQGVTNKLIGVMDTLNERVNPIDRNTVRAELQGVVDLIEAEINKHFAEPSGAEAIAARRAVESEVDIVVEALIAHQAQAGSISLDVREENYGIRDQVIALGERTAAKVLEQYLRSRNVKARTVENVTYEQDTASSPAEKPHSPASKRNLHQSIRRGLRSALRPVIEEEKVQDTPSVIILGGHIGGLPRGIAVDVGRSYTDTTANDTAIALGEINDMPTPGVTFWKDVDGMRTANPKWWREKGLEKTKHIAELSLREALEFAESGIELLQIDALILALENRVRQIVRNITELESPGTQYSIDRLTTSLAFKGIAKKEVDTIRIPKMPDSPERAAFLRQVSAIFDRYRINISNIFTNGGHIEFSIPLPRDASDQKALRENLNAAQGAIATILQNMAAEGEEGRRDDIEVTNGAFTDIAVVGSEMENRSGTLAAITTLLAANDIPIRGITHTSDQQKISIQVPKNKADKAARLLHGFFIQKQGNTMSKVKNGIEKILSTGRNLVKKLGVPTLSEGAPDQGDVCMERVDMLRVTCPNMAVEDGFIAAISDILERHRIPVGSIFTQAFHIEFALPLPESAAEQIELRRRVSAAAREMSDLRIHDETYRLETDRKEGLHCAIHVTIPKSENPCATSNMLAAITSAFATHGRGEAINVQALTMGSDGRSLTLVVAGHKAEEAREIIRRFCNKNSDARANMAKQLWEVINPKNNRQ